MFEEYSVHKIIIRCPAAAFTEYRVASLRIQL